MDFSRLPRFKRDSAVAPMQLTERDHDILRSLNRHRFLRSPQIVALVGGSSQQILRRLHLLYHHGFLERPRAQIDYFNRGGTRPIVYGLGNKGGALMRQERGIASPKLSWGEKNQAAGRIFLEHTLLVSDVMVSLELACRDSGSVRLFYDDQLVQETMSGHHQPFQWRVSLQGGRNLGVIPDRVFALEYPDKEGGTKRIYFFLEADRGTMPVKRRHFSQTSFFRKLLAYEATWSQAIHQKKFGFNRFRVLTVTTSAVRVRSLVEACSELKRGHGLFLFVDFRALQNTPSILTHPWHTTRPGVQALLLE